MLCTFVSKVVFVATIIPVLRTYAVNLDFAAKGMSRWMFHSAFFVFHVAFLVKYFIFHFSYIELKQVK